MTITTIAPDDWYSDLLKSEGEKMAAILDLFQWSTNHEHPTPWVFFLDLIGYSQDNFGATLYEGTRIYGSHIDLDYIAEAIKCWTVRPDAVHNLIHKLELLEV